MIDYKQVVRQALAAVGLELRRIPAQNRSRRGGLDPEAREEIAALERNLRRFSKIAPDILPWGDPARAREYLSDERIMFFRELLGVCRTQGVRLDGARIADIGSGTGYLLLRIARQHEPSALVGYDTYREITLLARHLCPMAEFRHKSL